MKKHIKSIISVTFIVTLSSPTLAEAEEERSFFGDVGAAISGHLKDITDRFADDQILAEVTVLQAGKLRSDDPGNDSAHQGKGTVQVVLAKDGKRYLQFGTDTSVSFAPDLVVYVSEQADIRQKEDFDNSEQIEIGELKKPNGASYYQLPEGVTVRSATVWCRRFSVFMTSANLTTLP